MKTNHSSESKIFLQNTNAQSGSRFYHLDPVIKLSLNGMLIYANTTGIDFIDMLTDNLKRPALRYLLRTWPEILSPHCNFDFVCQVYDTRYHFSAVAFKEAGYVGLYGYRQVHKNLKNNLVA